MVKVGFVVEGNCEKKLVESKDFRAIALGFGIEVCEPVIDAKGSGNLCVKNIEPYIRACKEQTTASVIFVLTDLECEPCFTEVRKRITGAMTDKVADIPQIAISRKAVEAWFLADTVAMKKWLRVHENKPFEVADPERTESRPFDKIRELAKEHGIPGPGTHKSFARKMINTFGFSLERAAAHPKCQSAKYFLNKLRQAGKVGR